MQRVAAKPTLTWFLLVGLLVASGVLTAVRGLGNATNVATCTGYGYGYSYGYSNPAPQLTLSLSTGATIAGTGVAATGTFTQNGCALPGETVVIQRRAVVNGVATGSYVDFRVAITDANGAYRVTFGEAYNAVYQARVAAKSGRPAVNSPARPLIIHPKVLAKAPTGAATTVQAVYGVVKPPKRGSVITLYRFDAAGNRIPVARQLLYSSGQFYFKTHLGRGYTKLLLIVGSSSTDSYGYLKFFAHRS